MTSRDGVTSCLCVPRSFGLGYVWLDAVRCTVKARAWSTPWHYSRMRHLSIVRAAALLIVCLGNKVLGRLFSWSATATAHLAARCGTWRSSRPPDDQGDPAPGRCLPVYPSLRQLNWTWGKLEDLSTNISVGLEFSNLSRRQRTLTHDNPTIHVKSLAGNISRSWTGKEYRERSDIVRFIGSS